MQIEIPPNSHGVARSSCTFDQDRTVFAYMGHAHEWGSRVRFSIRRANGESALLYDQPWEPKYASDSPMEYFSMAEPFVFHQGDTLELECEYENTTSETLQFPTEMCFMIGYYFPGKEQLYCAEGAWLSLEQASSFTK